LLESHYFYINELVNKVKLDDSEALSELCEFYDPLLKASVSRCLSKDSKLIKYKEDVEQESILALHQIAMQYDPELSYFSYFLSTRIDYIILSRCRKQFLGQNTSGNGIEEITFSEMPESWQPTDDGDPFNKIKYTELINNALNKMNPRQKEAIDLYFFQNYTQVEAAAKLNITQASFCKRLQRAIHKIKELISEDFII